MIIVTDFVLNQDFIAKTLCIQKEEQKGCNGKCYLNKQLTESNNQDKNQPLQLQNRIELSYFILSNKSLSLNSKSTGIIQKKSLIYYNQDLRPQQFVAEITHPPEAII